MDDKFSSATPKYVEKVTNLIVALLQPGLVDLAQPVAHVPVAHLLLQGQFYHLHLCFPYFDLLLFLKSQSLWPNWV